MVGVASAFYGPSDDVIELTPANFDSQVVNSADVWVIEFYAPWSVCVCVCVFVCVRVCVCACVCVPVLFQDSRLRGSS